MAAGFSSKLQEGMNGVQMSCNSVGIPKEVVEFGYRVPALMMEVQFKNMGLGNSI